MTLTVVSNPVNGGDVTSDPAFIPLVDGEYQGSYYPTDNVTVKATAKPGYKFVNWTGDVAEIEDTTQSTIVVAMDKYYPDMQQIGITANFAKQPRFPWGWAAGGLVTFLIAVLTLAILVYRRMKCHTDIQPP
jgi:hypothetical protein